MNLGTMLQCGVRTILEDGAWKSMDPTQMGRGANPTGGLPGVVLQYLHSTEELQFSQVSKEELRVYGTC